MTPEEWTAMLDRMDGALAEIERRLHQLERRLGQLEFPGGRPDPVSRHRLQDRPGWRDLMDRPPESPAG